MDDKRTRNPKFNVEDCFKILTDYLIFKDPVDTILKKYNISKITFYDVVNKRNSYEYLNLFDGIFEEMMDNIRGVINNNINLQPSNKLNNPKYLIFVGNEQFIKYTPEYFNAVEAKHNLYNEIEELQKNNGSMNNKELLDSLKYKYRIKYKDEEFLNNPTHPLSGSSCSIKELLRVDPIWKGKIKLYNNNEELFDTERINKFKKLNYKNDVTDEEYTDIKDLIKSVNEIKEYLKIDNKINNKGEEV